MDYDIIGKLETGQEDFQVKNLLIKQMKWKQMYINWMGFKYIWSKTGLDKSQIPVPWFNRIKSKDKPDLEAKYLIGNIYKYLILIVSIIIVLGILQHYLESWF